jgi:hypothetical protein
VTDATAPERAVPSVGPIEYESCSMPASRPRMWSGIVWFHSVAREDHPRHVGRARHGQRGERERQRVDETERHDRAAVAAGAHRDRRPVAVRAPYPAAGQREQRRADGPGGVEQAEQFRAAERVGHGGEQRDRDPEQHRVDVDRVAPDQLLA